MNDKLITTIHTFVRALCECLITFNDEQSVCACPSCLFEQTSSFLVLTGHWYPDTMYRKRASFCYMHRYRFVCPGSQVKSSHHINNRQPITGSLSKMLSKLAVEVRVDGEDETDLT